jgi:hypothetical protein
MLEHWPPKGCKLASQNGWYPFFQPWGQIQGHKFQHLLVILGRLKRFFSISALTPSVKPLGAKLFKYYWPLIIIIHTSTLFGSGG